MSDDLPDLDWRTTWPRGDTRHTDDDFVCEDGGRKIGRVYPAQTSAHGTIWKWFAWFPCSPNSGNETARRLAMLAIEDRYLDWRRAERKP